MADNQLQPAKHAAKGYKWKDAEPGNTLAVKSGVESERLIEARAANVRAALYEVCPWLDRDEYAMEVARYVRVETRALMTHEYITRVAAEKGYEKVSTRVQEIASQQDKLALTIGTMLGLNPTGQARISALASSAEINHANVANLQDQGANTDGYQRRQKSKPAEVEARTFDDALPAVTSESNESTPESPQSD